MTWRARCIADFVSESISNDKFLASKALLGAKAPDDLEVGVRFLSSPTRDFLAVVLANRHLTSIAGIAETLDVET